MRFFWVFVAVSFLAFFLPSSAFEFSSLSFNRSAGWLSFSLQAFANESPSLLPESISSFSSGEFTFSEPLVFSLNFSGNASYSISENVSALYSGDGGLALLINDGCYNYYGQDKCALAGISGPGAFSWCSACAYGNSGCGNSELHAWCYWYFLSATRNYSVPASVVSSNFSLALSSASNSSPCEINSLSSSCATPFFSTHLQNYSLSFAPLAFLLPLDGGWALLSPEKMTAYEAALASYRASYSSSLADAVSATQTLNAAVASLLASASGNFTTYLAPTPASGAFFSLSISLNASEPPFLFLAGKPRILNASSEATLNNSEIGYWVGLENEGFVDDAFFASLSCENTSASSNASFSLAARTSTSIFLPLTLSTQINCSFFIASSKNTNLNTSFSAVLNPYVALSPPTTAPSTSSSTSGSSGSSGFASSFSSPPPAPVSPPSYPPPPSPFPPTVSFIPIHFDDSITPEFPRPTVVPRSKPPKIVPASFPAVPTSFSGLFVASLSSPALFLAFFLVFSTALLVRFHSSFSREPPIQFQKLFRENKVVLRVASPASLSLLEVTDYALGATHFSESPAGEEATVFGKQLVWKRAQLQGEWLIAYASGPPFSKRPAVLRALLQGKPVELQARLRP